MLSCQARGAFVNNCSSFFSNCISYPLAAAEKVREKAILLLPKGFLQKIIVWMVPELVLAIAADNLMVKTINVTKAVAFTYFPCERYVITLGGERPLWALVRRTIREGKGVHREVESEESRIQNTDLTYR